MKLRFPKPLGICAGCLLGAAALALLQAEEYAMTLENAHPQWRPIAQKLREVAQQTRFSEFTRRQKELLAQTPDIPELACTLPPQDEDFSIEEPTVEEENLPVVAEEPKIQLKRKPIFPEEKPERAPIMLVDNHMDVLMQEFFPSQPEAVATITPATDEVTATLPQEQPTAEETPIAATEQETTPAEETTAEPTPAVSDTSVATAEPTTPEQPQEEAADENHPTNCRIMMVGDSLMEGLGPAIHRSLRSRKELHFILTAKYSTGLCRPDYFNWPEHMEEAIIETKPDIIVFFMGANDATAIVQSEGSRVPFKSEQWQTVYGEKMQEMATIAERHQCRIIWIGLPPFGGRHSNTLSETQKAQRAACERMGITFVDSMLSLADENGQYRTFMTNEDGKNIRLRRPDMCHLTNAGNKMLVEQLLPTLEATIKEFNRNNPHRRLNEEELARNGFARMQVTFKYQPRRRRRH